MGPNSTATLRRDLIDALSERTFDHARDTRPSELRSRDRAFDVDAITRLTSAELTNLRGYPCPTCKSRDCLAPRCEIGDCERHCQTSVEVRPGVVRLACERHVKVLPCDFCNEMLPRFKLGREGGELGCKVCLRRDPTEDL